ncbi:O-antigen ligase family protein [Arthrobacter sp. Helios]|uniref:O-antigen ligase family protein n=1 Tax=Arthrobacter sp. Helios TaxID=2828862 RepID=UPI00206F4FD4|nr:O-antigen ligase family protein [Arthrobacter sp. Helios]UPO77622.1 O-antigen ligase family protein [Arthrobacter sp. Helios]
MAFLTIYLVLTLAVPSYLTITPLGAIGRPSTLWGVLGLSWWAFERLRRPAPAAAGSPAVRTALLLFLAGVLISYATANLQGMPPTESTPADSGLIRVAGWVGIALLANEGITSMSRWLCLMRRLVLIGGLSALLGLAQFLTGQSLLEWIQLPGFSADTAYTVVSSRGEFVRPSGAASQPLEYAAVLSMVLPVALMLALSEKQRNFAARWWPAAAVALVTVISGSRSAFIGAAVGVLALVPGWSAAVRLRVLGAAVVLLGIVYVTVPGMAGTIRGMFLTLGNDSSSLSRTDSYSVAVEIALRNPFFGRGFGTFLPHYRIFDNGYLTALVELGLVGAGLLILMLACALAAALRPAFAAATRGSAVRAQGSAVAASLLAGGVLLAIFDGLNFSMSAALLFLMSGVAGAFRGLHPLPRQSTIRTREEP